MGRPRKITTDTPVPVTLRLPGSIRDELKRIARPKGLSVNAEIVLRLQDSLSPDRQLDAAMVREIVREELARAVEEILAKK